MAQKLDPSEIVNFKEFLISNSLMVDALTQLLIDKGLITEAEFFTKFKEVQAKYKARQSDH
jgi:hypothetical protein